MAKPIRFIRGSKIVTTSLKESTWMPSPDGGFVNIQMDISEASSLNALLHHRCNFVETCNAKSIPNLSRSEKDIRPSYTRGIGRHRGVVAAESRADFSDLSPAIPSSGDDTLYLPDERPPILDSSSKEASIDDIKTRF